MRLDVLDNGHRRPVRAFFAVTRRLSGVEMADVPKTLLYRPGFFGRPMLDLTAHVMRGDGDWPVAEREHMAMHMAELHRSPFCIDSHAEMTRIASDGAHDPRRPPRPQLATTLDLLDRCAIGATGAAGTTGDDDIVAAVAAARGAGVGDRALDQALHITVVWNVIPRVANAFGYELRDGQLESGTRALHRFGYRFPAVFTRGGGRAEPRSTDAQVLIARLRRAVLDGPAVTAPELRRAAAEGDAPAPWSGYVTEVHRASHDIGDADVVDLRAAGCSEDEVFEVTVAAAVGAALASFDVGRRALG